MDFLKKAMSSSSSSKPAADPNAPAAQKEDYADKGFSFLAKKAGINISRENQEKITDAGRGAYEKSSGKKVPEKFSN